MHRLRRWLTSDRRAPPDELDASTGPQPGMDRFHTVARERAERSPLIHLRFYFDLPFDVGIADGVFNSIDLSHPGLDDWASFDLQGFLELPPLPEPGVRPCVVIRFRRVAIPAVWPLTNVKRAYDSELARALPDAEDIEPLDTSITVVKAHRVVPGPDGEFDERWLRDQFRAVLSKLNQNLIAIGAAADDHRIAPVTEFDLPPIIVGWQEDLRDLGEAGKGPALFLLVLHQGRLRASIDHDAEVINHALAISSRGATTPFFSTMELLFAARRSVEAGRCGIAVIEAGTAIELLVSAVIRGRAGAQNWTTERLENVLDRTPFRGRYIDHFARALGVTVDCDASGSDAVNTWLRVAYERRNEVVHAGYQPEPHEAVEAVVTAFKLMDFVAERVARDPELGITFRDVSEMLPGPGVDERSLAAGPPSEARLAQAAFDAGIEEVERQNPPGAAAHFEEAYRHGSAPAAFNRGIISWQSGDAESALLWFRRAAELDHGGACAYLGVLLLGRGQVDEAEEYLRRGAASSHERGRPVATFFLASLLADRGELEEAAHLYRDAAVVADFSLGAEAAFRRGALLEDAEDPAAIDAYTLAASLGSSAAAAALGEDHRATGSPDAAQEMFHRALKLAADHKQGFIPIGHHIAVQLDPDQCRIERLVANGLGMTGLLLGEQGRDQEALAVFNEVIDRFGAHPDPGLQEATARTLTSKSALLGRGGDHAAAIAISEEIITRYDDSSAAGLRVEVANAISNKAFALTMLGRQADAKDAYNQLISRYADATEPPIREKVEAARYLRTQL
jgi:tetratricopeptide (TPR) repeat protein